MTPQREEVLKYLVLAERDRGAFRVLAATSELPFAVAGFHAQQAVEKALKAVMVDCGIEFRRTHDLQALSDSLFSDAGLRLPVSEAQLRQLMPFAVEARYEFVEELTVPRKEIANLVNILLDWARATIDGRTQEG